MKKNEIDYLQRRQEVSDSILACESVRAETKFLELLQSRIDDWPADEFGWLTWLRARPASQLVMGRAGGGSCFIFSPSEHAGYWAVMQKGMKGQGVLSADDVAALEGIAEKKGIRLA